MGFIGFEVSLDVIIDKIQECYSKMWNADWLQQQFYQLKWDKSKNVHQFAGHLEQKFGKLKLKFPSRFEDQQLKDRLLHGMSQQF